MKKALYAILCLCFLSVAVAWAQSDTASEIERQIASDLNQNGEVDFSDFLIFATNFGKVVPIVRRVESGFKTIPDDPTTRTRGGNRGAGYDDPTTQGGNRGAGYMEVPGFLLMNWGKTILVSDSKREAGKELKIDTGEEHIHTIGNQFFFYYSSAANMHQINFERPFLDTNYSVTITPQTNPEKGHVVSGIQVVKKTETYFTARFWTDGFEENGFDATCDWIAIGLSASTNATGSRRSR